MSTAGRGRELPARRPGTAARSSCAGSASPFGVVRALDGVDLVSEAGSRPRARRRERRRQVDPHRDRRGRPSAGPGADPPPRAADAFRRAGRRRGGWRLRGLPGAEPHPATSMSRRTSTCTASRDAVAVPRRWRRSIAPLRRSSRRLGIARRPARPRPRPVRRRAPAGGDREGPLAGRRAGHHGRAHRIADRRSSRSTCSRSSVGCVPRARPCSTSPIASTRSSPSPTP